MFGIISLLLMGLLYLICITNKLKEQFISFWGLKINSALGMDKLRTYRLIKPQFGFEKYLEVLPK